jgi:DNA-binding transcriptional LysR family regulator
MADAIEAGLGIGTVPHYMLADRPRLQKILTDIKPPTVEAYFVYPEELRTSKRVAVFRDFLLAEMPSRN